MEMSAVERIKGVDNNAECIVDILFEEVEKSECKTCGKCVYGYEGVTQLEMILHDITQKKGRSGDLELLRDLSEYMKYQSLCEKGSEISDAVKNAISDNQDIMAEHIGKKGCRSGKCSGFVTYHILPEKCTGCNECIDECEEDAILGKKRFIHVIDQEECIQCGACLDACDEGAIIKAGTEKPRCPKKPIPCKH
jgi:NADH:ubiquinone oxidoreductase subunit F (NADH-binding)